MTLELFFAAVSYGIALFGLGYMIGKDLAKTQK